jgi:hypothetical protein
MNVILKHCEMHEICYNYINYTTLFHWNLLTYVLSNIFWVCSFIGTDHFSLVWTGPQWTNTSSRSSTTLWTHCWTVSQRATLKTVRSWIDDYDPDQQWNGPIPTAPLNECFWYQSGPIRTNKRAHPLCP